MRGRTALVTGASLGIGRAIAREIAAEGVAVVMVARDAARLEETARAIAGETGARCVPIPADLTEAAQLDAAAEAALARSAASPHW